MSPTKLMRYTAWVDKKLLKDLKEISKETRIPASVLVREAIEVVISKYQKKSAK